MSVRKPCATCGGPVTEWAYSEYVSKRGKRYCSSACKAAHGPICSQGKHRYPTEAIALREIVRAVHKQSRAAKLRAYYHPQCGAWHMTSKERREAA